MKILAIAEHNHHELLPVTFNTLSAAQQIGGEITVLIAGKNCHAAAEQASKIDNIKQVWLADHEMFLHFTAENIANLIAVYAKDFTHIIAPATTFGKNLLPRAAALLKSEMISDIIAIHHHDTFTRPIFAGNALQRVKSNATIKFLTIRPIAFNQASVQTQTAPIKKIDITFPEFFATRFINYQQTISQRPELSNAKIVVAGGRALQNKENFALIEKLADALHAAIGASRAAVDAGFISNDFQVGQTGKVVAPDLYVAIGISGAIQHVAGMKDSKVIVAINKDPEAPIFAIADYGLVGDLFEVIPELIKKLKKTSIEEKQDGT